MCDIKTESENDLCCGCLSSDRKLFSLTNYDLYWSLLKEDQQLQAFNALDASMCWECTAMLRRMRAFQAQVQRAHAMLHDLASSSITSSLSSLTIHLNKEYDVIIKETLDTPENYEFDSFAKDETENIANELNITLDFKEERNEYVEKSDILHSDSDNHCEDYIDDNDDDEFDGENGLNTEKIQVQSLDHSYRRSVRQAAKKCTELIHSTLLKNKDKSLNSSLKAISKNKESKRKSSTHDEDIVSNEELETEIEIARDPVIVELEEELTRVIIKKYAARPVDSEKNKNIEDIVEELDENEEDSDDQSDTDNINWDPEAIYETEYDKYIKNKNKKPESDPEFEPDDEHGRRKKKKISNDKTDGKTEGNETERNETEGKKKHRKGWDYKRRFISRYANIEDVLPNFIEIEMSEQDIKNALEKEDAIVPDSNRHKLRLRCSECGKYFAYKRTLDTHKKYTHNKNNASVTQSTDPEAPEPPRSLLQCNSCPRLLRREHIVSHMNMCHRRQYLCNDDGCQWSPKVFWRFQHYVEHFEACHRRLRCDVCGKQSRNKDSMTWHLREKHSLGADIPCGVCGRGFSSRDAMKRHAERAHQPCGPPEQRYCVECDVTYRNIFTYRNHVNFVHGPNQKKSYPCEVCGKVLSKKSSYNSHRALFHGGRTKHQCHVCGKYLSKLAILRRHLERHDNKNKPVKDKPCTECGRMFGSNRILRFHMYTHTGERPYQCAHCAAAFTQPHCLTVHLRKTHGDNTKVSSNVNSSALGRTTGSFNL